MIPFVRTGQGPIQSTEYPIADGELPIKNVMKSWAALPPSLAGSASSSKLPFSRKEDSAVALRTAMNGISRLNKEQRGPEMMRILGAIAQHHPANERAGLLRSALNEVKCLPPMDEDYPQPTNDQIKAFDKAAHVLENAIEPREWPKTLVDLKETVEQACLGADWFILPSGLQEAVNYAKIKWPSQDTSYIFWKLYDLKRRSI